MTGKEESKYTQLNPIYNEVGETIGWPAPLGPEPSSVVVIEPDQLPTSQVVLRTRMKESARRILDFLSEEDGQRNRLPPYPRSYRRP